MPAAWDHRVLCAILSTETVSMAWALGLKRLQIPGTTIALAGMPFDMARNKGCMTALENNFSHVFFLDSDVIPPPDAIHRLLKHDLPIVSGLYCRRSPPHAIPVMQRFPPNGNGWVTEYPANALIEVDVVGAGCLLIRRDVLKNMQPLSPGRHWFHWRVDLISVLPQGVPALSEDFAFCVEAKRQNPDWKTIVDTSIQCAHVGYAEAGHGTYKPVECVPA